MGQKLEPGLEALRNNMYFAQNNGYGALEVAAFPAEMGGTVRDFYGETINADWVLGNQDTARDGVRKLVDETGVQIEALCYCANTLGDALDREHFGKLVKVANILDVPNVVGFIGNVWSEFKPRMDGDERKEYTRKALIERLGPIVREAKDSGRNIGIENCSMRGAMGYGDQSLTSNWFSTPAEMRFVLSVLPDLKMWFDPSHIRNYRAQNQLDIAAKIPIERMIREFGKYFVGAHLKDGEDDIKGMEDYASTGDIFGNNTHTGGLWIARAPGKGSIDWPHFEGLMAEHAPNPMIRSVEMEDLDVTGREANEKALQKVQQFYQPIIDTIS